jgi:diguanylate cyclase (GGDEF)-like protein
MTACAVIVANTAMYDHVETVSSCQWVGAGQGGGCGAGGPPAMASDPDWGMRYSTRHECRRHADVFPDRIAALTVQAELTEASAAWITGDLAAKYSGAHVYEGSWLLYPGRPMSAGGFNADRTSFNATYRRPPPLDPSEYYPARKLAEAQLLEISLVDELTGLNNRRGFNVLAHQLMQMARRMKLPVAPIYAGLDGMKQINDTLGHATGDQALVATARLLKGAFPASDLIARLGGDEFVVLALESQDHSTNMLLARLQEHLQANNMRAKQPYSLLISFGLAHSEPEDPRSIEALLEQADQAMLRAKAGQRPDVFMNWPNPGAARAQGGGWLASSGEHRHSEAARPGVRRPKTFTHLLQPQTPMQATLIRAYPPVRRASQAVFHP